jgi:hypothetical protein
LEFADFRRVVGMRGAGRILIISDSGGHPSGYKFVVSAVELRGVKPPGWTYPRNGLD